MGREGGRERERERERERAADYCYKEFPNSKQTKMYYLIYLHIHTGTSITEWSKVVRVFGGWGGGGDIPSRGLRLFCSGEGVK